MRERPILFSAPMVTALLEGRKGQTRRLLKPQPYECDAEWVTDYEKADGDPVLVTDKSFLQTCPHGRPGDRLLVAMEIPQSPNDDYCAGSDGRIYSRTRYAGFGRKERTDWYPLVGHRNTKGYQHISLCHENRKVTKTVHRLVCSAFYGPAPFPGAQVRHLDGNPENNEPSNLCWGSQAENWQDRKAQGRGCEGEKHHAAKLSNEERAHVRWAVSKGLCSQKAAARALGLSQSSIGLMMDGAELRAAEPFIPERIPRINLDIAEVRVQRLQDISEEDAKAEGVMPLPYDPEGDIWTARPEERKYRSAFEYLWGQIHGWPGEGKKPGASWADNPHVFAISFRRVEASHG